jgi:hypothetical protein
LLGPAYVHPVTSTENMRRVGDVGAVVTFGALALIGMIPWIAVLFGGKPAYSAEAGAAVTVCSLFLLGSALWDLRRARAAEDEAGDEGPR